MTDAQLQVIAEDLLLAHKQRDEAVSIARGLLMILESVVGAIGPSHHAAYRAGQVLVHGEPVRKEWVNR